MRWVPSKLKFHGKSYGVACAMTKKNISKNVEHQIDENLRRVFQDKLEEDVPDRFKELLEKLKQQEQQK